MKQLLFILFFPSLLFAQTDSTDIIVQNIMKQQKIVGLSLAVIKKGEVINLETQILPVMLPHRGTE